MDAEEQTWAKLPPHVLINIYTFLNISDIITLSLSNKWYQEFATHNDVWEIRCLKLRNDLLFLTISTSEENVLPKWLLNLEEAKKTQTIFQNPPRNFYFINFMKIWCRYPHAWKRGNTIVDCKFVVMKKINRGSVGPSFRKKFENWKDYYSIRQMDTFWLHNNQNGSYIVKRFTIKEPFYFSLPFSNMLYGVDPSDNSIKSIPKPDKDPREPYVVARFQLRNYKLERVTNTTVKMAKVFGVITGALAVAYVGTLLYDDFTSFRLPYYVMNFKDTCDIIRPGIDQWLNPNFQGSLIHQINTRLLSDIGEAALSTGLVSVVNSAIHPAIIQLQTVLGVNSLFSYDDVNFKNIIPDNDLCVFITSEGDVSKYHCAFWEKDDGRAKRYAINWIHDMDDGKYDQMGKEICVSCGEKEGTLVLENLKTVGSFCGEKCANTFWYGKN